MLYRIKKGIDMKYITEKGERTAREIRIGKKFTIVIYRKCKRADKRVEILRDAFFGTGVTVLLFLKF